MHEHEVARRGHVELLEDFDRVESALEISAASEVAELRLRRELDAKETAHEPDVDERADHRWTESVGSEHATDAKWAYVSLSEASFQIAQETESLLLTMGKKMLIHEVEIPHVPFVPEVRHLVAEAIYRPPTDASDASLTQTGPAEFRPETFVNLRALKRSGATVITPPRAASSRHDV